MAAARKNALPNVTIVPAVMRDIVQTYEAVGTIESPFNVKLAAKITGRIDYLQAREGDAVTQGQVLARVDPSEITALVAQQQSNVAEAQQRLAQAQLTQGSTNVGVTTNIAQQQATVSSAQADYSQQRENYNAQVAAANAAVTDAQEKITNAQSAVRNGEANLRSAQANLNNAQVKLNRTLDLYKQGFIAAQDVDDARTQVEVQRGAVDVANGQLAGAQAQVGSAQAQLNSAKQQASIVATKGKADIEAARQKTLQAQAALKFAQSNRSQTPAYQANLRALQAAVTAAQANLRNTQAQLANTVLTSPMNGFVTQRLADPGTTVTAGTPILAVQSLRQVYVTTSVPEEISHNVRYGEIAPLVLDAFPNRNFVGKVTQINPAADPQSRQFTVRLTLDNPTGQVRPGMFARVTFETKRIPNAIQVPREAVKADKKSGGQIATVVGSDNIAHIRMVKMGASSGANVQILDGVKPGENLVTLSLAPVKEGQKVNAVPAGGATGGMRGGGMAGAMGSGGGGQSTAGAFSNQGSSGASSQRSSSSGAPAAR